MSKQVQIIQVPYDSANRGIRMGGGPEHFIQSRLEEHLRKTGWVVNVECVEAEEHFRAEIRTAFELYRIVSERVKASRAEGKFPLVLSGNCNSSLGTIAGIGTDGLGIIWFDGHGDFNTPETSISGFLDGMGLATAVGLCWKKLAASIPGFHPVMGSNVTHVGVRDFSDDERVMFDQTGVAVVGAEAIRRAGVSAALEPALEALSSRVDRIYLHFDLDVLDPDDAPANEFAPPDGLTLEQVIEIIEMIGKRFSVCACGIASYDPGYDRADSVLHAGFKIMESVLKEVDR